MEVIGHPKALSWVKQRITENTCPPPRIQNLPSLVYHAKLGAHFTLIYQNSKCILKPLRVVLDTALVVSETQRIIT